MPSSEQSSIPESAERYHQVSELMHLTLLRMELEGTEDSDKHHPDPKMRAFYRGAHAYLTNPMIDSSERKFEDEYTPAELSLLHHDQTHLFTRIMQTQYHRVEMNDEVLNGLLPRVVQYSFVLENNYDYLSYDEKDWFHFFKHLDGDRLEFILEGLKTLTVQTNVLQRGDLYHALERMLPNTREGASLEIGGSEFGRIYKNQLGRLGFESPFFTPDDETGVVVPTISTLPPATFTAHYNAEMYPIDKAHERWTDACRYFSEQQEAQQIRAWITFQQQHTQIDRTIHTIPMDVTKDRLRAKLGDTHIHAAHMSIVSQQWNEEQKKAGYDNILDVLGEGCPLVETKLMYKEWFGHEFNVETVVRFKVDGAFTRPFQVFKVDNTRIKRISKGEDFDLVMDLIKKHPNEIVEHFRKEAYAQGRLKQPLLFDPLTSVEDYIKVTDALTTTILANEVALINAGPAAFLTGLPAALEQMRRIRHETVPEPPIAVMTHQMLTEMVDTSQLPSGALERIQALANTVTWRLPANAFAELNKLPIHNGFIRVLITSQDNPILELTRGFGKRYYLMIPASMPQAVPIATYEETKMFAAAHNIPLAIYALQDREAQQTSGMYPDLQFSPGKKGVLVHDIGFMNFESLKKFVRLALGYIPVAPLHRKQECDYRPVALTTKTPSLDDVVNEIRKSTAIAFP